MKIDVLTLFPQMFHGPLTESILKRGQDKGIFTVETVNIRDFSTDKHRTADDYPFGGGAGMVMKAEPLFLAYESVPQGEKPPRVILMCPQGEVFSHQKALELAQEDHLIFVCGHYEGIDERVRESFITDELSIGDFVLTGGELPAMVIIDAVCRLLPGVVKEEQSVKEDSFADGLLEYPQYTRPAEFRGLAVPEALLSGNHERIRLWRRKESLRRTLLRRPELLAAAELTKEDHKILAQLEEEGIHLPEGLTKGVRS